MVSSFTERQVLKQIHENDIFWWSLKHTIRDIKDTGKHQTAHKKPLRVHFVAAQHTES